MTAVQPPMTLAQYTDALSAAVTTAGEMTHAWHGRSTHRIYRGEDYVEVFLASDGTGGFSSITGRDRGFGAALRAADRALGDITITAAASATTPLRHAQTSGRRTGCSCGSFQDHMSPNDCASCQHDS